MNTEFSIYDLAKHIRELQTATEYYSRALCRLQGNSVVITVSLQQLPRLWSIQKVSETRAVPSAGLLLFHLHKYRRHCVKGQHIVRCTTDRVVTRPGWFALCSMWRMGNKKGSENRFHSNVSSSAPCFRIVHRLPLREYACCARYSMSNQSG